MVVVQAGVLLTDRAKVSLARPALVRVKVCTAVSPGLAVASDWAGLSRA